MHGACRTLAFYVAAFGKRDLCHLVFPRRNVFQASSDKVLVNDEQSVFEQLLAGVGGGDGNASD